MKKNYKAPYFRPRFMNAIEPLMVSAQNNENGGYDVGGLGGLDPGRDILGEEDQ